MILPRFYRVFRSCFPSLSQALPYVVFALLGVVFLIDPALADIFTTPPQKANWIKPVMMIFAKLSVAIAFLACLLGALAGIIHCRWVVLVFIMAIALAIFDILLTL